MKKDLKKFEGNILHDATKIVGGATMTSKTKTRERAWDQDSACDDDDCENGIMVNRARAISSSKKEFIKNT